MPTPAALSPPPELTPEQRSALNEHRRSEDRLSAEQRATTYLELYKQQMSYFHETRRIEFQANLALWGAIFALGYALAGKVQPSLWLSLGFVASTVVLSGLWAWFLQKTKGFDKRLFAEYRARIEHLLEAEPLNPAKASIIGENAWWLFYVLATALFSTGVVVFLRSIPLSNG